MTRPSTAKRVTRTALVALLAVLLLPGTIAVVVHRAKESKVKAWHATQTPTIESQQQPAPTGSPPPTTAPSGATAPPPGSPGTGTSVQPRPPRQAVDPSLESGGNTGAGFNIAGDLQGGIAPGHVAPLELTLVNPGERPIEITKLSVKVAAATSNPGCSGEVHFRVRQAPEDGFPLVLPAKGTRTLSELGFAADAKPQVEMVNLPVNQDACKGAAITLSYSGAAR
jgi:hypothetical protein